MRKYFLLLILFSISIQNRSDGQSLSVQNSSTQFMNTDFDLQVIAENDSIAAAALQTGIAEINRIEKLIAPSSSNTQLDLIRQNAGIATLGVDTEFFDLVFRAKKISKLTYGAFDISIAPLSKFWNFNDSITELPNDLEIGITRQLVNWKNIMLDHQAKTIFLKEKGMQLEFGAMANGFAINKALPKMKKLKGVKGVVINSDHIMTSWGENNKPTPETIYITDPKDTTKSIGRLDIKNTSIATIGTYEDFFTIDGTNYSQTIDPRTGYPVTGIKSVTIVCSDAEVAMALANAVFVLGQLEGLALINQLVGVECLIITDSNKLLGSERLRLRHD